MKVYLGARSMEAPANLSNLNFCERAKCGCRIWVNRGLKPVVMRPVNHSHLSGLTLALTRLLLQRTGCINGLLTPLWERVILASSWWPSLSCIEIIPEHGLRKLTAPNFKKIKNICGPFFSKFTVEKWAGK